MKMKRKEMVLFVLAAVFQVCLCYWLNSGGHLSYAAETPEPASLLLIGAGILFLRKQNRKNNS